MLWTAPPPAPEWRGYGCCWFNQDSSLDIAKSIFQVHGVDGAGRVVVRRQLKRRYVLAFFQKLQPCLVGIEGLRLIALKGR
jgi:transposase